VSIDEKLSAILAVVQRDVGLRGLARLFAACPGDFAAACDHLAGSRTASLGVVTGFWIPGVGLAETDGPLGAVYLARTLDRLDIPVKIISDPFCRSSLEAGLIACGRLDSTSVIDYGNGEIAGITHLLALERVGPSHVPDTVGGDSLQAFLNEVPLRQRNRSHTMRGIDISDQMRDVTGMFERPNPTGHLRPYGPFTIGIGDGGNEIGMGKIPWQVIRDDIPNGGMIACRVPTDFLIVAGISNWGAYALACGVAVVKGVMPPDDWFDVDLERRILREMVEKGPLVDGVTGRAEDSVDGLAFEQYIEPLTQLERIVRG
jgi:D-glutamate cyclase